MKLLIISHTPHYLKQGRPAGWTATVREIDHLSGLFEEVVHIAPLYKEGPIESADFYKSKNILFHPVNPAGGKSLKDKLGIIFRIPEYIFVIWRELKKCDVVHVRSPANISLIAILILMFEKNPKKRWMKYAGNWNPEGRESWSYAVQRFILQKNWVRAQVTVNGNWPDQPSHIHSFLNPCISEKELEEAKNVALHKKIRSPISIIFVGRTETEKGLGFVLDILKDLKDQKVDFLADIVGDSSERCFFEEKAKKLGLEKVFFYGWLSREKLNELYAKAHFILLPSLSEGWPKVLSEAMAYGVLPLAAKVGSIPQYLERLGAGKALDLSNIKIWREEIFSYMSDHQRFSAEVQKSVKAASHFSYTVYLKEVRKVMGI